MRRQEWSRTHVGDEDANLPRCRCSNEDARTRRPRSTAQGAQVTNPLPQQGSGWCRCWTDELRFRSAYVRICLQLLSASCLTITWRSPRCDDSNTPSRVRAHCHVRDCNSSYSSYSSFVYSAACLGHSCTACMRAQAVFGTVLQCVDYLLVSQPPFGLHTADKRAMH